jgi:hypothetical protein
MNALAISLQSYFTTFAHTQRDLSANRSRPTATPGGCC